MKALHKVPFRPIAHRFVIYLLVFCMVNVPVWALNWSSANSASFGGNPSGVPIAGDLDVSIDALRAIINWNDINTINGQTLSFNNGNLSAAHAVLNRVIGGDITTFNGNLNGGLGHILLINPNGIIIGSTANITAGRFTASTMHLQMPDQDFLDGTGGEFRFVKGVDDPGAKIALLVNSEINAQRVDLLAQQIINAGTITTGTGGIVAMATGDNILLGETGSNVIVELSAPDSTVANWSYNVINEADGVVSSPEGTIVMAAGDTFAQAIAGVQNQAFASNTYTASQRGVLQADVLEMGAANQADFRSGSSTTGREIKIGANTVRIEETLQSSGEMIIDSDSQINALKGLQSGQAMTLTAKNVQIREDMVSNATITVIADTLCSRGNIASEDDLLLMAESVLWGETHQTIRSETSVKSTGSISKITEGNLYISAADDVQLDDDVSAVKGGVSVIAENGKIHTGDDTDTLNVAISGYSDEITDSIGVELELPDGEGKAAIVLKSHDTLNLGSDAALEAKGFYLSAEDDPDNGVDNRPDITFLDTDGTEIGGWERDEGVASDVAIYVGTETGNVNVATSKIETAQPGEVAYIPDQREVVSGPATVVFDAQDTVTMPALESIEQERNNQENDNLFRFRLEVVTRITEWLYQAVQGNKLPYAGNPEAVEAVTGQDYVLRGAGLDNPQITDGRIWVLENPPKPSPTPTLSMAPVAPLPDQELPELVGCPAEMEAAARELDIHSDELQLKIQNSMATNPNLQPCDACARLLVAAGALQDRDGARFAAMIEIFDTLAPLDAPFTPEVSASIVTKIADMADQDPQYALANDYIDSFVNYVAVLNHDLKTPVGDAVVYTLNKYGEAVMSNPNQNMISFLVEQLETENISL